MSTTVNGWAVIQSGRTSGSLPRLRKFVLPDVKGQDNNPRHLYLRDGACGFVLMHNALWFHEEVERLDVGIWDEWGWAIRPVRGQTSGYSNHAGGVACDLNATRHPLGVAPTRTFTDKQIRAIRHRMDFYDDLIIWGGNWSRPDGMHFEIADTTLKRIEHLAERLADSPRGKRVLDANKGLLRVIRS